MHFKTALWITLQHAENMYNEYAIALIIAIMSAILWLQANLKLIMESVFKGDVDKLTKLLNKGLDANFIDKDSGGNYNIMSSYIFLNV